MTSPSLTDANIDKLAELFPTVVTESVDADGNVKMAVDFDLLRQIGVARRRRIARGMSLDLPFEPRDLGRLRPEPGHVHLESSQSLLKSTHILTSAARLRQDLVQQQILRVTGRCHDALPRPRGRRVPTPSGRRCSG